MRTVSILTVLAALLAACWYLWRVWKDRKGHTENVAQNENSERKDNYPTPDEDAAVLLNREIWRMKDEGSSQRFIAAKLGISRSKVQRELKRGRK